MPDKVTFRHEYKYEINYFDYLALRQRLLPFVKSDPNADENGFYRITSLYFDNFHDKALMEKMNGVNIREKFRIRYYNDNHELIRLEKKFKQNGMCLKSACPITRAECQQLLSAQTVWMRDADRPLIRELYHKMTAQMLKPKTLVVYQREPYVYPVGNVRITFDSQIETGIHSQDLFHPVTIATSPTAGQTLLLELKYDEFIPDFIRDLIQLGYRTNQAFSKYAICRQFG